MSNERKSRKVAKKTEPMFFRVKPRLKEQFEAVADHLEENLTVTFETMVQEAYEKYVGTKEVKDGSDGEDH